MNSSQKLKLNTITSLILQLTTLICGFILPSFFLSFYGSDVNGLINSITQFLGIISLLDMGVGSVVQSALYKPLAYNDVDEMSKIHSSASKFFRRIAIILTLYIIALIVIYPTLINNDFDFLYTAFLIVSIGISNFAEYYFGIVNRLFITADQRGYVYYSLHIITQVSSTIVSVLLMYIGMSVQMVKLVSSLIHIVRPVVLALYVKKHYRINKFIKYDTEPITQKWNGISQHFASFVLGGTDTIVLTLFSDLSSVSVYSVYNMVIMGIKNLFFSVTKGFEAFMGELLAKKDEKRLNDFFRSVEWIIHTMTVLLFGCTGILIVPFVEVYTFGINDTDYIKPLFAVILTVANASHCLRMPYHILIYAAGHFKQTQKNYIIAMIINIVISVGTVFIWGLIGVAIGTFVAMAYQTLWMVWYDSKNIINYPLKSFLKQSLVDILTVIIASLATFMIPLTSVTYGGWFLQAAEVFACWLVIVFVINLIFYKDNLKGMYTKLFGKS